MLNLITSFSTTPNFFSNLAIVNSVSGVFHSSLIQRSKKRGVESDIEPDLVGVK